MVSEVFLKSAQFLILLSFIACVPDEVTIKLKKISNYEGATITLDAIANQTVVDGVAISTINAGAAGIDFSANGDALAYTCFYDTNLDASVLPNNSCSTLSGISFSSSTGEMSWTPNAGQVGTYEFKIQATDGKATGERLFTITVNSSSTPPTNHTPVLDSIADQIVNEGTAISTIDANDGGDDLDSDGDALTYSCYYDTTVDGNVANTTNCTSLTGLTFSSSTGVMAWTPDYSQAGVYEFKIRASDGSAVGEKIFTITVTNVNRAPSLSTIANQTVSEGSAITSVDAGDGGDDFDVDGQSLTYTCYYDTTVDGAVAATSSCSSLSGATFSATTGALAWTTSSGQAGNYEFKISASDGSLSDSVIFSIQVTASSAGAPFITKWRTTASNESITLPLSSTGTYNFVVDWGDGSANGTVTSYSSGAKTHTYAAAGTYTVTVTGVMSAIYTDSSEPSRTKLIEVVSLGSTQLRDLTRAFGSCTGLTSFAVGGGDTSLVTSTSYMFYNTRMTSLDVTGLNTSNVTNMSKMFSSMINLTSLNLTGLDTGKVTNMSDMFFNTYSLPTLNLSMFDTRNVTTMDYMFGSMSYLTSLNISSFVTDKVTNMTYMFSGLTRLTSVNLSGFNTSQVTNMGGMFFMSGMTTLNLANFDTQNLRNADSMFYAVEVSSLNLSSWDTRNLESVGAMFNSMPNVVNINLTNWDVSKVTSSNAVFNNSTNRNVICNQGGSPGTGTIFGEPCH